MKELFTGFREATRVRKPGKVVRHPGTGNYRNSLAPPGCRGKWGAARLEARGGEYRGKGLGLEPGPTISPAMRALAE